MSVCAAPTCSHQSFDGSSYYVDVDVYCLLHHVLLSSVERRTINDQEAIDSILVQGVFIMFFFKLLLIYNYSQLYHPNAKT